MDASVNSIQMLAYFILSAMKAEGKRFFSRSRKARDAVSGFFSRYTISFSVAGFGGTIEGKVPVVAIQEEFYSELAEISENIQKHTPVTVIMLDEAEHLQNIEGAWGFLRSVFTRLVENDHHFFVIVSGKLGLFKDIKEIFSPMERFFFPKGISVFNSEETSEAIEKPMTENHVSIVDEVKGSIAEYTDGHPFIIQVFGFYLFELREKKIDSEIFQRELPNILERLKVQVFQDRYYSASPKEKMVLDFMASSEESVFRPVEIGNSLKIENPSQSMHRLVEKDCLRKIGYGEYTLFHKLFKQFIRIEKKEQV